MQNRRAGVAGVVTRRRESEITALGRSLSGKKTIMVSFRTFWRLHLRLFVVVFFFFQRRVDSVQNESRDLESENAKLHKTVESLRHSLRRLNDLEKENTDLESENHRLDRESKGLHKEIVRLKQAIEVCWTHQTKKRVIYIITRQQCVLVERSRASSFFFCFPLAMRCVYVSPRGAGAI